jgi:hypothetical protein
MYCVWTVLVRGVNSVGMWCEQCWYMVWTVLVYGVNSVGIWYVHEKPMAVQMKL